MIKESEEEEIIKKIVSGKNTIGVFKRKKTISGTK